MSTSWQWATKRLQERHRAMAQSARAREGMCIPEWECSKCATRMFLEKASCRSCGKEVHTDQDVYVDEHGHYTVWPTADAKRILGSKRDAAGAAGGNRLPRGRQPGAPTHQPPSSPVGQAKEQLRMAKEKGMSTKVIELLTSELAEEEHKAFESKSIGKKIEAAQNELRVWTKNLLQREETLNKATEKMEEARTEVTKAHQQLTSLMAEASQEEQTVQQQAGTQVDTAVVMELAHVLSQVIGAVKSYWPPATTESALPLVPAPVVKAVEHAQSILPKIEQMMKGSPSDEVDITAEEVESPEGDDAGEPLVKQLRTHLDRDDGMGEEAEPLATQKESQPRPAQTDMAARTRPWPSPSEAKPGSLRDTIERAEKALPALKLRSAARSRSPLSGAAASGSVR